MKNPHTPVLYKEILNIFEPINHGYIIDCTTGFAGHSLGLVSQNKNIKLICNDQDEQALYFSQNRLKEFKHRIIFNKENFKYLLNSFKSFNIRGVLADIGVSSFQLDTAQRGFNFESEVLDMRMNQNQDLNASIVVNKYSQKKLEKIFKEYGEIKESKKITSLIVNNRPFNSSKKLAQFLSNKIYSRGKIHPATLVFQAIRIEVNDELSVLNKLFKSMEEIKLKDCIIGIISFHSLEDKIVKSYFKKWSKNCICPLEALRCTCGNNNALGKIITKKPITPSKYEIKENPRSRSSKLRVFKFD